MDATTILMNIYGIPQSSRKAFLEIIEDTDPRSMELCFANLSSHEDDEDYDPEIERWMERYLPEMYEMQMKANGYTVDEI